MTRLPGQTQTVLEMPFRVELIAEVPAPEGSEGTWQQYVITQGSNTITGLRAGTLPEVSAQLESMVERLNERFGKQQAKLRR